MVYLPCWDCICPPPKPSFQPCSQMVSRCAGPDLEATPESHSWVAYHSRQRHAEPRDSGGGSGCGTGFSWPESMSHQVLPIPAPSVQSFYLWTHINPSELCCTLILTAVCYVGEKTAKMVEGRGLSWQWDFSDLVENASKYVSTGTRWLKRAHQGYSYGPLFFKYYLHEALWVVWLLSPVCKKALVILKHELDVSWV